MTDEYATLRTAFHAGATIQAYTVEGDDGRAPHADVDGRGYWRDLCNLGAEPKFSCHPTRYRVKDHHPAEAPVAYMLSSGPQNGVFIDEWCVWLEKAHAQAEADDMNENIDDANFSVVSLYLRPDPEVAALRAEVERLRSAEWISIYDRMPEIGQQCLVVSQRTWENEPSVKIDRWDEQHECPVSWSSATVPIGPGWDDHDVPNDVILWRPLPEVPSSELRAAPEGK
jgi:hypothetical protein